MKGVKIFLVGNLSESSLEMSYLRAAKNLGYKVFEFDLISEIRKHIKLGKIGSVIHNFLPVEAWTKKMNRELIVKVKEAQPDVLMFFTNAPVLYGTLATIKIIAPRLKIAWIWSDTPMNLQPHNLSNASLVDISATYSSSSVEIFKRMGFNNAVWVPLGGDEFMHHVPSQDEVVFSCDISFVGGFRPERERVMKAVAHNFQNLVIEVHGPGWKTQCRDPKLKRCLKGGGFYGRELATFFSTSRINVNPIDDTNFPAANMRFFEVCTAGGLQLASSCPEMEELFIHQKHLLYFKNETELMENIEWVLKNSSAAATIRQQGQQRLVDDHTYSKRLSSILEKIL